MMCVDPASTKAVWDIPINKQESVSVYASPTVAGEYAVFAGRDQVVRCLRAKDGTQVWQFKTGGDVDSSPVVVGDHVFLGSSDGTLYELALTDGREIWRFDAGAPITASPAVAEGRLVVGAEDGTMYCFGQHDDKPQ
jgi:outer membrane protein assembly factor BamB